MWLQMTQWVELDLMEGGEACQLMVCNGQRFQFLVQKENISMCVCVCSELWGGVHRAVNTHLVAWSKPRTPANQSWVQFLRNAWRQTTLGRWRNRARLKCKKSADHSLPPGVCPPLSVPTRTPSLPPLPQACWGCTCSKCKSWAFVFAVSQRWMSRDIRDFSRMESWPQKKNLIPSVHST